MRYFKWGIARIILETSALTGELPVVVPMFIEGLDQVMHESRSFPRFLPRLGKHVSCTYGQPIDEALIQPFVSKWRLLLAEAYKANDGAIPASTVGVPDLLLDSEEAQAIRRDLTKVVRDAVVDLRLKAGYPAEHPEAHRAEFYDSSEGLKYDELSGIPRPEIFHTRATKKKVVYEKEGPT